MYEAKGSKTASFKIFDDRMSEMIAVRASMREELDRAIRDHELGLALQPLVDARTGDLDSVEALLRWPRCSRGDISPADLIPMAEESGQILPQGAWVQDRGQKVAREHNAVPEEGKLQQKQVRK